MNMKNIKKIFCGSLVLLLASCSPKVTTTNYYFDPVNGDDTNKGTTVQAPFKSLTKLNQLVLKGGDSILLKSGAIFAEKLFLSCSGEEDSPIVLGKYGGTDKPHVKGNGVDTAAVHIFNSENLVIRDIEISNRGNAPKAGLFGLWVELDKFGESHNMSINNLYIHDVYGSTVIEEGGGMGMCIQNGRDNDSIFNRFVGMNIENCYIKDCQRDGIKFRGYWIRSQWNPNLKVVIRNNVLDGVPGDGIVPVGCDGALVEYNVMKNCPRTLPESEACDGIWPWCSDNTIVQFNVVSDHKSIIDGYAYDSDWGCKNSVFQYNLSYNNDGGFMLVIGTDGWPEDWCLNGNIETKVRYNVSINDGLRNYLTNASHEDAYFSPVMHFTGYTQNTLVENNLFYLFPKSEPQIDRTLFHFTKHDSSYGKGDTFKNNYIYAPEVTVVVKEEKAVDNQYLGNVYVGSLQTPATGFKKHEGPFSKSLWYNAEDKNWDILLDFLKGKTVPINGKELKVLDVIGAN
ncbi:right-handed parallel beta-helix repeat-containing protein [Bacteroides sp.]|uniref:right-handed parallel beta-helix repeat-containing protein n=1 Tax=Bacteroides sp. TaxID=29523 RepID=UPI0026122C8D|nr:right-handed parallel beta-helix repeat-containing protein [Bacteroides sp.]